MSQLPTNHLPCCYRWWSQVRICCCLVNWLCFHTSCSCLCWYHCHLSWGPWSTNLDLINKSIHFEPCVHNQQVMSRLRDLAAVRLLQVRLDSIATHSFLYSVKYRIYQNTEQLFILVSRVVPCIISFILMGLGMPFLNQASVKSHCLKTEPRRKTVATLAASWSSDLLLYKTARLEKKNQKH